VSPAIMHLICELQLDIIQLSRSWSNPVCQCRLNIDCSIGFR